MSVRFTLPDELSATRPPAVRDRVRMLVASRNGVEHAIFADIGQFLKAGDLVVVNTSATLPAALDGRRGDNREVTVHFSGELDEGSWVVELRPPGAATGPLTDAVTGEQITLPVGVRLTVTASVTSRLWAARINVEGGVKDYLARVGRPISYAYVPGSWPISDYQTVFGRVPGSAEMPSAGRPFTADVVTDLAVRGIAVAPILLHTGVSSPEAGEPPQPERYAVPAATARLVNHTRRYGGRVIAVGTTVTRALETATDPDGTTHAGSGWTDLVLSARRPARATTGLITGWHAPGASHLDLLEAVAGGSLVAAAYEQALRERYLWHEFGDSCLFLP